MVTEFQETRWFGRQEKSAIIIQFVVLLAPNTLIWRFSEVLLETRPVVDNTLDLSCKPALNELDQCLAIRREYFKRDTINIQIYDS